jgi:acylphosphatase
MSEKAVRHLRIRGRVQGVGYRMSMVAAAIRLGVNGWVRNCRDGSVEAMIQGEAQALDEMVAWAQRGPAHARVDGVELSPGTGEFSGFNAWPDA